MESKYPIPVQSDTYSEVSPSNNWQNEAAHASGGTVLRQDWDCSIQVSCDTIDNIIYIILNV